MKHCGTCGTVKDESDFHVSRATHDGLQSRCKKCKKEYNHKYAVARCAAQRERDYYIVQQALNEIQGAR